VKQHFFFDLDGTLVDSLPGITGCVNATLPPSVARVADVRPFIGPPIRSILHSLAHEACETDLDRMECQFRRLYDSGGWRDTVEFAGAGELLETLHAAGKQIFLVTNKPGLPTANILEALGWHRYFEDVLTPDSRTPPFRGKDQMLRELVKTYDLRIDECLMVGDTADDGAAAAALGMQAVFVAHGYGGLRLSKDFPDCRMVADLGMIATQFVGNGAAI
jgi:phosphoglycolate phosphatase